MTADRDGAARHWPLFGLEVRTSRLVLRYLDDDLAAAVADAVATHGVHDPDEMPFHTPWTRQTSPQLERSGLQSTWQARATTSPAAWTLPFAAFEDDALVGSLDLRARDFATLRTVATGSWVSRPRQGRGLGREMRAAVLHLAFAGLGAELAASGAFADNHASLAVTRSFGYVENGWHLSVRDGVAVRDLDFVLDRAIWADQRRDDIEIVGLEPCLDLLGISAPGAGDDARP